MQSVSACLHVVWKLRLSRTQVNNYEIVVSVPPGDWSFTGNSVGLKQIVEYILLDKAREISILDIGFGIGDLGKIIKANPATKHWVIDGVDGYIEVCKNTELFKKRIYRNIWHGLALDISANALSSYDVICLFDVIEHLDVDAAKRLLADILNSLSPDGCLVLSTPLWFWQQSQKNPGNLEERKITIPAKSLMMLAPLMYHIHEKYLVGTFVFSKKSIDYIDNFLPITDTSYDFHVGLKHLQMLGLNADGVLYFVK